MAITHTFPAQFEEERFRVTLASIGDGVIATDESGKITFLNPIAEQLTGWAMNDAIGQPLESVFRIFNEFTGAKVVNPVEKVLRLGRIVGIGNHTVLMARDGTERPIDDSGAPVRDANGSIAGVVLVFRDVGERRRADFAARRLAAIVEHSIDAIVGKDLAGRVTSWNRAAERIFGYTAAEMVGQSITRLFPPDRLDEEQRLLAQLQRGERVEPFETIRIRKDGRAIHVQVSISPVEDPEGRVVGASKIARDITHVRQQRIELERMQRQLEEYTRTLEARVRDRTIGLEEKVGELEAFSYSLSHDMRAPLRAIRSFSEIVLDDYGNRLDEAGVGHLRRVINAAARMDRLIQDVLSFSRLSRRVIVAQPVDVERLVDDLVAERPELQLPRASIIVERPLLRIQGHAASLTQCLSNLLDNAVKFVAPGVVPRVRIRTERSAPGRVRLWVEDNGIGIRPESQRRLFGLFQRLHPSESYAGSGVGLAIVKKAVARMLGDVGVESEPDRGSRFWIELSEAAV